MDRSFSKYILLILPILSSCPTVFGITLARSEIMKDTFDILIAGGGMVGASLAAALQGTGLRVAVVEPHPFGAPAQPSYDDRATALGFGSRVVLDGIGVWRHLAPEATPIRRVHVSQRGSFGAARFDCREEGVEALGYLVENRAIGRALERRLTDCEAEIVAPGEVSGFSTHPDRVEATVTTPEGERTIVARLLVAADGMRSRLREMAGIGTRVDDYGQVAVIANITPSCPHDNVAFERFTDEGPIALLPMSGGRCALVWTHAREAADETLALDDESFIARFQRRFGHRLGPFLKVGRRFGYPLARVRATHFTGQRLAVIGNAAHTVHPVSGQGFNLALRDVAELAERLADCAREDGDPGDTTLLSDYAAAREADIGRTLWSTDFFVRSFIVQPPLGWLLRAKALLAVDFIEPLHTLVARHGMGTGGGRQPRLLRGLDVMGNPR